MKRPQVWKRRKTAFVAGLLVLAAVLAWWVVTSVSTDRTDPIAVTGLIVTAVALVFQVASFFHDARADPALTPALHADELAAVLEQEWRGEVDARRLRNPRVLPLEWAESRRPVSDPAPAAVIGASSGVIVALKLSGRLDSSYEEATRKLAEGYRRIPSKRLVILGEPGSGKSVLALLLGLGLTEKREPGRAVPVLLPLSSWDPLSGDLDAWIVSYLAIAYYNGDSTVPRVLLKADLLLPILDGLDEIPEALRRTATREINRAVQCDRGIVVTCRSVEFQDLIEGGAPTLRRAPVVEVRPVLPVDAIGYLNEVEWPDGVAWDRAAAALIHSPECPLAQALSTPLMIGFARAVYERLGGDPAELADEQRFGSRHAVEEYLTDRVVDAAYAPAAANAPTPRYSAADARRWLTFLARHMQRHRERELQWWLLAPRLLPWWVGPAIGIACGTVLAAATAIWILAAWTDDESRAKPDVLTYGISFGALLAVLVMMVWFAAEGRSPGRLSLTRRGSLARLRRGFPTGVIVVVTVGVPLLLAAVGVAALTGSWTVATVESLYAAASTLLLLTGIAGLITAVGSWCSSQSSGAARATPGLTLRQDRRLAWWGSALPAITAGLLLLPAYAGGLALGALIVRASTGWSGWPGRPEVGRIVGSALDGLFTDFIEIPALAVGRWIVLPAFAVYVAFVLTRAWPRFALLRLLMAARRRLPLDLSRFLDDARSRNLLRQTAGAYQFSHVRLQESLANAPGRPGGAAAPAQRTRRKLHAVVTGVVAVLVLAVPFLTLPKDNATLTLPTRSHANLSTNGQYLAVATDKRTVTVWGVARGEPIGEVENLTDPVSRLEFTPDARLLVVQTTRPPLEPEPRYSTPNLRYTKPEYRYTVWDFHSGSVIVRDVAEATVLAGGRALLTVAPKNPAGRQQVDLWDTGTRRRRELVGVASLNDVAFPSPTSGAERFLAPDGDGQPAIFAATGGAVTPLSPFVGTEGPPAIDPSGTVVFAPTPTGTSVWRAADGGKVADVETGPGARVYAAPAVNRMIVTSGRPQDPAAGGPSVAVYDISTGQRIGDKVEVQPGFDVPSLGPEGRVAALMMPARAQTQSWMSSAAWPPHSPQRPLSPASATTRRSLRSSWNRPMTPTGPWTFGCGIRAARCALRCECRVCKLTPARSPTRLSLTTPPTLTPPCRPTGA